MKAHEYSSIAGGAKCWIRQVYFSTGAAGDWPDAGAGVDGVVVGADAPHPVNMANANRMVIKHKLAIVVKNFLSFI